ncbi:MAG: hypothetical protein NXI02_33015 [Rhodobacteraceae bacterium]|nr:hypothetical protein [Paracoccaceae bacterium]
MAMVSPTRRLLFSAAPAICCFVIVLAPQKSLAWSFQRQDDLIVATEVKGEWSAYYSGTKNEAVFCIVGPYKVVPEADYAMKLRVGAGKWLEGNWTAYDHETLCEMNTKTAHGLVGALVKHGSLEFGIYIDEAFHSFQVTNDDWLRVMGGNWNP